MVPMEAATRVPSHGETVEDRARYVAARLGLADFVYRAQLVNRGEGSREPGDAILYANGRGAVIQVKARDPHAAVRDTTTEKVQRWVDKHGAKAYRQGQGTRRELLARRAEGRPVLATPVRAAHLPPDAQEKAALVLDMDVRNWPTIVVFDHPGADRALAPVPADAFWITLPDWRNLHRAIRSTTGLLDYIHRVLASDPTPRWTLGTEGRRFAEVVATDRRYAAEGGRGSRPYLDYSTLDDPLGVELYRDVLERVWPEDGSLPMVRIEDYRRLMEHLDALPPSTAADMGRWIASKRRHLLEHKSWASGAFLTGDRLTVYACDHADNHDDDNLFVAELVALMTVRAIEIAEQGRPEVESAAIGVLQGEAWLDYRFAYATPPLDMPPDIRLETELRRGVFDLATRRVRRVDVRRNSRCPCGSGRKFKVCHGR
jgi:hypothetical protein